MAVVLVPGYRLNGPCKDEREREDARDRSTEGVWHGRLDRRRGSQEGREGVGYVRQRIADRFLEFSTFDDRGNERAGCASRRLRVSRVRV